MLPEDRLQMKWRESEGSGLGYLVQVQPMAGKDLHPPRPPSPLAHAEDSQCGGRSHHSGPRCPSH